MFEYQLPQEKVNIFRNASASPMSLNLENDVPSVLEFPVGLSDIGGSLVVELGINIGKVRHKSWNDRCDIFLFGICVRFSCLASARKQFT